MLKITARALKVGAIATGTMLVGIALGVAAQYSSESPAPTPHTSQSCLNALTQADASIRTAGAGFGIVSEVLTAASNFDAAGIEAASAKLQPLNDTLGGQLDQYTAARDACRGE